MLLATVMIAGAPTSAADLPARACADSRSNLRRCAQRGHKLRAHMNGEVEWPPSGKVSTPPTPQHAPRPPSPASDALRLPLRVRPPACLPPSPRALSSFDPRRAAQVSARLRRALGREVCADPAPASARRDPRAAPRRAASCSTACSRRQPSRTPPGRVCTWKRAIERGAARWNHTNLGVQGLCGSWGGCPGTRSGTSPRERTRSAPRSARRVHACAGRS